MSKIEKKYNQEIVAFGKRIRNLRKEKNITQLDVEIACGISRTEISRIENGLKNIEFLTIVKLSMVFEVPIIYFFYNE